ncbi:MAG TPA: glycosyl transferase [Flavobacteriales bacterium]|nr:glycosyl transferase [Flavobacteriales bacterium]
MTSPSNTPHAYVINLAKATDRMAHMRSELNQVQIDFTRIEAVLGDELSEPINDFDERRFNQLTGKHRNKREIGCYFSHIKALKSFLETSAEHALILEDDIHLPDTLPALLGEAIKHSAHWDLLRLTSSRKGDFINIAQLDDAHQLAYNAKVLKNTGAYLINRNAAERCIKYLLPMRLPYDVALDREWDCGFKTACITPFPIKLEDFPGQIPRAPRIRIYRATTFHLFHLLTHFQRIKHRKRYAREAGIL